MLKCFCVYYWWKKRVLELCCLSEFYTNLILDLSSSLLVTETRDSFSLFLSEGLVGVGVRVFSEFKKCPRILSYHECLYCFCIKTGAMVNNLYTIYITYIFIYWRLAAQYHLAGIML